MKTEKQLVATGKMSNLVGMWAIIWKAEEIHRIVFVYGKADDDTYIIQHINALSGDPNVCQLFSLREMKEWTFCPTVELVNEIRNDFDVHKRNRYKILI